MVYSRNTNQVVSWEFGDATQADQKKIQGAPYKAAVRVGNGNYPGVSPMPANPSHLGHPIHLTYLNSQEISAIRKMAGQDPTKTLQCKYCSLQEVNGALAKVYDVTFTIGQLHVEDNNAVSGMLVETGSASNYNDQGQCVTTTNWDVDANTVTN